MEQFGGQFGVAILAAGFIQWLKANPRFSWITIDSARMNRIVAAVVAVITGLGVAWTFDAEGGTLIITGLTWQTVTHGAWAMVTQFAYQHFVYHAAVKS